MQIGSAAREMIAVSVGGLLGVTVAGGAYAALISDDASNKNKGVVIAGSAMLTATFLGATMLGFGHGSHAAFGALGFVGLPAMLMTGMIQNDRDIPAGR